MNERSAARAGASNDPAGNDLAQLLDAPVGPAISSAARRQMLGVLVGTLVGFADVDATPLVTYHDQPGPAALPAHSIVSLDGAHVGRRVVLMFEEGDPDRPIVMGCIREAHAKGLSSRVGQVVVDADGDRLTVSAKERIVLRCGKASITLTKEGKLILQGAYVSSQSSGVLRIKGGSVQIN